MKHYEKIDSKWVKANHQWDYTRCPDKCASVYRTHFGWDVCFSGKILIRNWENRFQIIWDRNTRHFHFEKPTSMGDNGFINLNQGNFSRMYVLIGSTKTLREAIPLAIDNYFYLKDLGVLSKDYYCFDEKDICSNVETYGNPIPLANVDLGYHQVQFKDGTQSVLIA